jgi:copper chaperone CopZ
VESGTTVISLGYDYDAARASALKAAIARTGGVDSVEFNYPNNKLTVKFDSRRVSLAKLEAIVMRERKHRSRSEM